MKFSLHVVGMLGFGDNIHQRALLRLLMEHHEVSLETCHAWVYHDLVAEGLRLILKSTALRMQAANIARERDKFTSSIPVARVRKHVGYGRDTVSQYGSILDAMLASVGLLQVSRPDFSLPIRVEWRDRARCMMATWPTDGRPILIYRPIVLRREWPCPARNPDPATYATLFASLRERYFVVSIAALAPVVEWIVGPEQDADLKLHAGDMDSGLLAALFAEASMVFANPGFAPALAQAVGTPVIVVYGGRECYDVTDRAGAHLSPTLGIDTDHPCRCFSHGHQCNKHITLPPAIRRVEDFADNLLGIRREMIA